MPERLTHNQISYDNYVSSGSGDICFAYGMSGNCGPDCPEFGMRDGCRDAAENWNEDEEDSEDSLDK